MKYFLFLFPLFLVIHNGIRCQPCNCNSLVYADSKTFVKDVLWCGDVLKDNIPFSGVCIEYYPNGQKRAEASFINGKKDGQFRNWSEDGLLITERQFKNGKHHGIMKNFSLIKNNVVTSEKEYFMDVKSGIEADYNVITGQMLRMKHYKAMFYNCDVATLSNYNVLYGVFSKRVGEWETYYKNGQIKLIGQYSESGCVKDVLDGEWIYYNEDGKKERSGNYRNGELVSGYDMDKLIEDNF
jgi:antitoxin component YwqK of YwqJK toxin-antitoxin module